MLIKSLTSVLYSPGLLHVNIAWPQHVLGDKNWDEKAWVTGGISRASTLVLVAKPWARVAQPSLNFFFFFWFQGVWVFGFLGFKSEFSGSEVSNPRVLSVRLQNDARSEWDNLHSYILFPTIYIFEGRSKKIGLSRGWLKVGSWLEIDLGSRKARATLWVTRKHCPSR